MKKVKSRSSLMRRTGSEPFTIVFGSRKMRDDLYDMNKDRFYNMGKHNHHAGRGGVGKGLRAEVALP